MPTKPRGLGKGLGALMGDASLPEQEGSLLLPVSQVEPGLNQPRKRFDPAALDDLADSVREHGVIQPITVRRLSSGYYQIIAGERRWRAAKQAGLDQIPAVVIEADDRKVLELGLIENLQRADLDPMEEAEGYAALINEYGLTQDEVAQRMGKSRPAVTNALRLLSLPENARSMLADGQLSAGHARAVLAVRGGEEEQAAFADFIVKNALSVRQAEQKAKTFVLPHRDPDEEFERKRDDPNRIYIKEVEKDLSGRFGRKVAIHSGAKKGKLELEFYGVDDLNHLLDLLEQLPASQLGKGVAE